MNYKLQSIFLAVILLASCQAERHVSDNNEFSFRDELKVASDNTVARVSSIQEPGDNPGVARQNTLETNGRPEVLPLTLPESELIMASASQEEIVLPTEGTKFNRVETKRLIEPAANESNNVTIRPGLRSERKGLIQRFNNLKVKLLSKAINNELVNAPQDGTVDHPKAGTALAFGILGLFLLPIIFGPVAAIVGGRVMRDARNNPGKYSEKSIRKGKAGYALGMISLFAMIILLLVFLLI